MAKAIEEKRVKRRYLGILRGEMQENMEVSNFLGNDPDSEVFVKQRVLLKNSKKAKKAETVFEPIAVSNQYSFCRIRTLSGRKHQIRAHAQWAGYELVGEKSCMVRMRKSIWNFVRRVGRRNGCKLWG